MSPSFLSVCLTVLSAVPEPAAVVCPPVAQFFGILGVSAYQPALITAIYQERVTEAPSEEHCGGALEPWLSFPATFSPSDLKQALPPGPRARLWGL